LFIATWAIFQLSCGLLFYDGVEKKGVVHDFDIHKFYL
jgi:hypothetical protein